MKKLLITLLPALAFSLLTNAQTLRFDSPLEDKYNTFSVIGDSYSTYVGMTEPATNAQFYPHEAIDVYEVTQTWWKLFERETGIRLEHNNSYSGGTICNTWWNGADASTVSFVYRSQNLRKADLIIIEGGTNDSNAGSPIGNYMYGDWTSQDLKAFRPALAKTIDYLQQKYPEAQLVFMLNNGLKTEINTSVEEICKHYDVPVMTLSGVSKALDHPTYNGMQTISHQLVNFLLDDEYLPLVESQTITRRQAVEDAKVYFHMPLQEGYWTTLCLPFSLTPELTKQMFGDEHILAEYSGQAVIDDNDPTSATMIFTRAESIEAGKPYLVRPSVTRTKGVFIEDFTLPASSATNVKGEGFTFAGLYRTTTFYPNQPTCFLVHGNGTADIAATTTPLGSMHAYIIAPKGITTVNLMINEE